MIKGLPFDLKGRHAGLFVHFCATFSQESPFIVGQLGWPCAYIEGKALYQVGSYILKKVK
jgi:hypothetical protein